MNNYQNFEFKSYTPTPTDQYMLGIAKVKLYGKLIVNFKHVKTKDGTGSFFCTQNYTTTEPSGEKKYLPCVQLTDRDEEEMLLEYVRQQVNYIIAQRSATKSQPISAAPGQYYPHGMAQHSSMPPMPPAQSMDEVAANEAIPF